MSDSIRNMLALLPNWLGDAAMCTPALRALHRRFPEAALTVAGRPAVCELIDGLPYIAAAVPLFPKPGAIALPAQARRLRPHARDLAVVFPHSMRAALLARLAGAHRRLGYARGGRSFLLTDSVAAPRDETGRIVPVYMACEYLDLLAPLGCTDDGAGLELRASSEALSAASRCLPEGGLRVGLAPGGAFGLSKRWMPERFAAVADALTQQLGAHCVLLSAPDEGNLRQAVRDSARTPLDAYGDGCPSIDALKAAISQLDLLVCNDSGTRHIAVAFGVPTVCVMGSTSPLYSAGPYERGRVVRVDVDCGPCQKPECETDHRCMTRITPEIVIAAALEVLEEKRSAVSREG